MPAIIFDFDGVIVESESHWGKAEHKLFRKLLPGWGEADQTKLMGLNLEDTFALLKQDYALPMGQEEFRNTFEEIAMTVYGDRTELFPGVRELLQSIDQTSIPLGIASSSRLTWIMTALERFELDLFFWTVVSGDEFPGDGKPSPTIYLSAAEQLDVPPAECVAIEDSRNGIRAAKAAGMMCFGFRHAANTSQDLSQADRIIESLEGLDAEMMLKLLEVKS